MMIEKLKMKAREIAEKAAQPIIRSMYPSRSRAQMANEFYHFIVEGIELANQENRNVAWASLSPGIAICPHCNREIKTG